MIPYFSQCTQRELDEQLTSLHEDQITRMFQNAGITYDYNNYGYEMRVGGM